MINTKLQLLQSMCVSLAHCQNVIDLSFLDSMTPGDSLQRSYQGVRPLPRAHQLCLHWQCAICLCSGCSLPCKARGTQVWPACANSCSHRYISTTSSKGGTNEIYIILSTVNRLCGSGFQSIVNGVQEILAGDAQVEDFQ